MTDTSTPTEPTAEELAAAQAVIARKNAADFAKVEEAKVPVRALVGLNGFDTVLEQATTLKGTVPEGTPFFAHLNAIVTGMANLKRDATA